VIVENSFGLGADGVTRIPNEASAISVNGGLGGGSTGNVVGDGDEALQNATVDVPGEHTIEVGMCIFNTMINGVAYRYASVR
jgi:hypothetical protein